MAITKIQSESLNLADTYAFTGTVTGAGESNVPYFRAHNNADFSFSSSSTTKMRMNTVVFDSASGFSTTNYNYTIPSGHAGKWIFYANLRHNGATNIDCRGFIFKNNTEMIFTERALDDFSMTPIVQVYGTIDCSVGDTIDCRVYSTDGAPQLSGASDYHRFSFFEGFKLSSS